MISYSTLSFIESEWIWPRDGGHRTRKRARTPGDHCRRGACVGGASSGSEMYLSVYTTLPCFGIRKKVEAKVGKIGPWTKASGLNAVLAQKTAKYAVVLGQGVCFDPLWQFVDALLICRPYGRANDMDLSWSLRWDLKVLNNGMRSTLLVSAARPCSVELELSGRIFFESGNIGQRRDGISQEGRHWEAARVRCAVVTCGSVVWGVKLEMVGFWFESRLSPFFSFCSVSNVTASTLTRSRETPFARKTVLSSVVGVRPSHVDVLLCGDVERNPGPDGVPVQGSGGRPIREETGAERLSRILQKVSYVEVLPVADCPVFDLELQKALLTVATFPRAMEAMLAKLDEKVEGGCAVLHRELDISSLDSRRAGLHAYTAWLEAEEARRWASRFNDELRRLKVFGYADVYTGGVRKEAAHLRVRPFVAAGAVDRATANKWGTAAWPQEVMREVAGIVGEKDAWVPMDSGNALAIPVNRREALLLELALKSSDIVVERVNVTAEEWRVDVRGLDSVPEALAVVHRALGAMDPLRGLELREHGATATDGVYVVHAEADVGYVPVYKQVRIRRGPLDGAGVLVQLRKVVGEAAPSKDVLAPVGLPKPRPAEKVGVAGTGWKGDTSAASFPPLPPAGLPKPTEVAPKEGPARKSKTYAVAHGRKTGVFTTWKAVDEHTARFPDAYFRSFETRGQAERWLASAEVRAEVEHRLKKKADAAAEQDNRGPPAAAGTAAAAAAADDVRGDGGGMSVDDRASGADSESSSEPAVPRTGRTGAARGRKDSPAAAGQGSAKKTRTTR